METKEDVPGVSPTGLKRTTQQFQTGSATGSVSERQDGRQPAGKAPSSSVIEITNGSRMPEFDISKLIPKISWLYRLIPRFKFVVNPLNFNDHRHMRAQPGEYTSAGWQYRQCVE